MTIRIAAAADIPLIERGLAQTPNPPTITGDAIQGILDNPNHFFYIDTAQEVFVWLSPNQAAQDVKVVYWIWDGDFSPAQHTPVLGAACRAVKKAIPAAGPWPIWGNFPGDGDTDVERKADSTRQAQEHSSWLGDELTDKDADNPKMRLAQSTLDAVIASIDALEVA